MNSLQKLFDFLNRLDDAAITYNLDHVREDTITVVVSVPAERWEIEFYADGSVEIEVFYSNSEEDGFEGEEALERLFEDYTEDFEEEFEDDDAEDDEDFEDEEEEATQKN